MNELGPVDNETSELLERALDYYSKKVRELEEIEKTNVPMPLFEGQVEASLLEIESIKKSLKSEEIYGFNIQSQKLKFIIKILNFYKNELLEDIEELEIGEGKDKEIDLLEKETEKISGLTISLENN